MQLSNDAVALVAEVVVVDLLEEDLEDLVVADLVKYLYLPHLEHLELLILAVVVEPMDKMLLVEMVVLE